MKAFWWYKENEIAGLGRPGFNLVHWLNLPFVEAVMIGWIGTYSTGQAPLESFRKHLQTYVPRIYKFHKLDEESGPKAIKIFETHQGILDVMQGLARRTQVFSDFKIAGDDLHFTLNKKRLATEIDFLKDKKIKRLVSLTENHHDQEILEQNFLLYHIAIKDLGAPEINQVKELVTQIKIARDNQENLALHCLAGIGRTSTMMMAAHILLGYDPDEVKTRLAKQNPYFALTNEQAAFLSGLLAGSP